jgi:hypothetical protein
LAIVVFEVRCRDIADGYGLDCQYGGVCRRRALARAVERSVKILPWSEPGDLIGATPSRAIKLDIDIEEAGFVTGDLNRYF